MSGGEVIQGPQGFRRAARPVAVGAGLLAALVAVRFAWERVADRMLAAEVREIAGQGEPILPEDFDPERVVDPARNAAVPLGQAGALIIHTSAENRWAAGFVGRLPLSAYDVRTIGGIREANQRSLKLARDARLSFPGVDWGIKARQPLTSGTWRPSFNTDRQLATLLCNVALHDHSVGRSVEALELVRDTLFLSRTLEFKGFLPNTHMEAVGVATLACQTLDQMAPTLPANARPQAESLIAELLDTKAVTEGFTRALQGRRMFDLAVADDLTRAAFHSIGYHVLRPMIRLDTRRLVRADTSAIEAAKETTYPAASRLLPPTAYMPRVPHLADVTRAYSTMAGMAADPYVRAQYLHLLDRRFTATALATRLYYLDHAGEFPPALDALVPGYLPAVPADPMSSDEKAIGYVAGRVPPVLYSVGMNALDERGDGRPYNPKYPYAPRTLRYDMVYPLLPVVREDSKPPGPSTRPSPGSQPGEVRPGSPK